MAAWPPLDASPAPPGSVSSPSSDVPGVAPGVAAGVALPPGVASGVALPPDVASGRLAPSSSTSPAHWSCPPAAASVSRAGVGAVAALVLSASLSLCLAASTRPLDLYHSLRNDLVSFLPGVDRVTAGKSNTQGVRHRNSQHLWAPNRTCLTACAISQGPQMS